MSTFKTSNAPSVPSLAEAFAFALEIAEDSQGWDWRMSNVFELHPRGPQKSRLPDAEGGVEARRVMTFDGPVLDSLVGRWADPVAVGLAVSWTACALPGEVAEIVEDRSMDLLFEHPDEEDPNHIGHRLVQVLFEDGSTRTAIRTRSGEVELATDSNSSLLRYMRRFLRLPSGPMPTVDPAHVLVELLAEAATEVQFRVICSNDHAPWRCFAERTSELLDMRADPALIASVLLEPLGPGFPLYAFSLARGSWDGIGGSSLEIARLRLGTALHPDERSALEEFTEWLEWADDALVANEILTRGLCDPSETPSPEETLEELEWCLDDEPPESATGQQLAEVYRRFLSSMLESHR